MKLKELALKHAVRNFASGIYASRAGLSDASFLAPTVPVGGLNGEYLVFDKDKPFVIPDTRLAADGIPRLIDFGGTATSYSLEAHGLQTAIPTLHRQDSGIVLDLQSKARMAAGVASIAHFKAVYDIVAAAAGAASGDLTDAAEDPIDTVNTQIAAILLATGAGADLGQIRILWGVEAWQKFASHALVRDRIKGGATPGAPGVLSSPTAANGLFMVPTVNRLSLNAGTTTIGGTKGWLVGAKCLVFFAAETPSVEDPSAFKTLSFGTDGLEERFAENAWKTSEAVGYFWQKKAVSCNAAASKLVTWTV